MDDKELRHRLALYYVNQTSPPAWKENGFFFLFVLCGAILILVISALVLHRPDSDDTKNWTEGIPVALCMAWLGCWWWGATVRDDRIREKSHAEAARRTSLLSVGQEWAVLEARYEQDFARYTELCTKIGVVPNDPDTLELLIAHGKAQQFARDCKRFGLDPSTAKMEEVQELRKTRIAEVLALRELDDDYDMDYEDEDDEDNFEDEDDDDFDVVDKSAAYTPREDLTSPGRTTP